MSSHLFSTDSDNDDEDGGGRGSGMLLKEERDERGKKKRDMMKKGEACWGQEWLACKREGRRRRRSKVEW